MLASSSALAACCARSPLHSSPCFLYPLLAGLAAASLSSSPAGSFVCSPAAAFCGSCSFCLKAILSASSAAGAYGSATFAHVAALLWLALPPPAAFPAAPPTLCLVSLVTCCSQSPFRDATCKQPKNSHYRFGVAVINIHLLDCFGLRALSRRLNSFDFFSREVVSSLLGSFCLSSFLIFLSVCVLFFPVLIILLYLLIFHFFNISFFSVVLSVSGPFLTYFAIYVFCLCSRAVCLL